MSNKLIGQIKGAAEAYYHGEPIMTDEEYDQLVDQLALLEGDEAVEVAGGIAPEGRKVELPTPMLSLDKVTTMEGIQRFLEGIDQGINVAVEPKWDGMICQVVAENGEVTLGATRGNGYVGERVTDTVRQIVSVQELIQRLPNGTGTIFGEVLLHPRHFETILDVEGVSYTSPRSAAAGILNRRDEAALRMAQYLSFREHEVDERYHGKIIPVTDHRAIMEHIGVIEQARNDDDEYDIDGAVIKVADQALREQYGSSTYAPRWAVAYKYAAEEKQTQVSDVVWQIGRTGVLTPVAILEPVTLVDATVTNATLHNLDIFNHLDLSVGDTISIKRSGDVIPYITDVVSRGDGEQLQSPTICPQCGTELIEDGPRLMCTGSCNIQGQLSYALASLSADGIGPSIIESIIQEGLIGTPISIVEALERTLQLTTDDVLQLPRQGERSSQNVINAIQSVRDNDLTAWIVALGIPKIGWVNSSHLAHLMGSQRDTQQLTQANLSDIPGFGQILLNIVLDNAPLIEQLDDMLSRLEIETSFDEVEVVDEDTPWSGKHIVLTGTFPDGVTRNDATDWLITHGATIQGSVTGKTDLVIAGEKAGSKRQKAEQLGITIESPEELVKTIIDSEHETG